MKLFVFIIGIQLYSVLNAFPVKHMRRASKALRNVNLFDGDIVVKNQSLFNAVPNDIQLWPFGVIPYEIDPRLRGIHYMLEEAFKHFQIQTCIQFIPRIYEENYVYITSGDGDGCRSEVGMSGGQQELVLGTGCGYMGTVLHELMHLIGFFHEHSRSDRDMYLDIHYDNIVHKMLKNFIKLSPNQNRLLEPFDYQSITIYGEFSFSKNGFPTMTALTGELLTDPNFKSDLSLTDVNAVKKLYQC